MVGEGLLLEIQASGKKLCDFFFFFFFEQNSLESALCNQTEEQKDNSQKHTKNETK